MFEKALLRKLTALPEMDIGLLAETLLFYQNVHIVLDPGTATSLEEKLGVEMMKRLVHDRHARFSYNRTHFAATSSTANSVTSHQFVEMTMEGREGQRWSPEEQLMHQFRRRGYERADAAAKAKAIFKLAPLEKWTLSNKPLQPARMAYEDVRDREFLDAAARIVIRHKTGLELANNTVFLAHEGAHRDEIYIESNIDFKFYSRSYQKIWNLPENEELNAASVLAYVVENRADLTLASKHMAEGVTTPLQSDLIRKKFALLAQRRNSSEDDIRLFEQIHLQGRSLRQAINSGERSFSEFLDLLDGARKFKNWLKDAKPEAGLLSEYHDAVVRGTWVDRLPAKSTRFAITTGAGMLFDVLGGGGLGSAAGFAIGAADTFLMDKIVRGWKPNHFVEEELGPFVRIRD